MGSATILSNLDEAQSGLTGRLLSSVDEYSSQAFHDTQRPGTMRGLPGFSATTPGELFWTRHRIHFRWTCSAPKPSTEQARGISAQAA